MPENHKPADDDSRPEGPRRPPGDESSAPRPRPVLDVESERREFGDSSDIHHW
jgi:hypothetical protein